MRMIFPIWALIWDSTKCDIKHDHDGYFRGQVENAVGTLLLPKESIGGTITYKVEMIMHLQQLHKSFLNYKAVPMPSQPIPYLKKYQKLLPKEKVLGGLSPIIAV